jgi:hypothetical protein
MEVTHNPASARPRNHLAAINPEKLWTKPMNVMTIPQATIDTVSQIWGLNLFRRILDGTSKRE